MNDRGRLILILVVAGSITLGTTACKNDTLGSGTERIVVNYIQSPTGAGRYTAGVYEIKEIKVLPTNPETAQIYGNQQLTLRFSTQNFRPDLVKSNFLQYSTVALSDGTYQVTSFKVEHPNLVEDPLDPPPYPTCIDGVQVLNAVSVGGAPDVTLVNPYTFTIHPGQTTLSIKVNVPGFIAAYEAAFTCHTGCGSGGSNCVVSPFDENAFRAAVLANFSIE